MTRVELRVLDSLRNVEAAQWNALVDHHPLLRYEFLHALHETGCACERSGWLPQFVTAWRQKQLVGAMPLYLKSHSYGEYVFDWAWADAYHRNGLEYYPKLLCAIPFSPVGAPKLLARDPAIQGLLADAALELGKQVSSVHVLFPTPEELTALESRGMMVRRGVQFHWLNDGYESFEQLIGRMSHDKRKKIKQERRKVREAGITFRRLVGREIDAEHWKFFNRCYRTTYRAHHSTPYLSLDFFKAIGATLPDNVLMVLGERAGKPIAAVLNLFDARCLYGRYWGTTEYHSGLHFEACYYQALEFCIERGIAVFEGGAQGEHKLARGFTPVETRSAHWLKHPRFASAIEQFLAKEGKGIERYIDELNDHSPFKAGEG